MTVTEKGRHRRGRGPDPHKDLTSLQSDANDQNRGYSQDVREDESWVRKIKKAPRANSDKYRDNKNTFFTKVAVAHAVEDCDKNGNKIQPRQLVTKPTVTIQEKK
jgi:hypothetical protein